MNLTKYQFIKTHLTDTQYRLVQSYLLNGTFAVRRDVVTSRSKPILSGVPQGSVLGPLLYITYTHEFPRHNAITVAQFADDIALLSRNNSGFEATTQLQTYLNEVDIWTSR